MNFLNWFTGPKVRFAGFIITLFSVALLHGVPMFGYLAGLIVAAIATYYPNTFNWLSSFADPQFWPSFVGLGIAILFAAYTGGAIGLLACIGPLTTYDGMYFEQNY